MKKIFTLFAAAFLAASANAQTVIYSWESPEGEPIEVGGTMVYTNGDGDRLNYSNSNAKADVVEATQSYYTICLNGKKPNIDDATASANAGHMVLNLEQELAEGDKFIVTGYYNKGAEKKVSMYMRFDNGKEYTSALFTKDISQVVDGKTPVEFRTADEPETKEFTVDGIAGCKSFKMTRGDAATNLFITKFVISREGSTAIKNVNAASAAKVIKTIENGQLVIKSAKGTFNVAGAQMK